MTLHSLCRALLALLLLSPAALRAQEGGAEGALRAERVFGFMLHDQADSLLVRLSDRLRPLLDRQQLAGGLAQVEAMAGAYRGHGPWQVEAADSLLVCASVVDFEHAQLRMVVTFNPAWQLEGLRMMPLLPVADAGMPLPADAVELADTVRTGGVALPCTVVLSGRSASPPLVVMVHGSGPLDRDETVMANKPFRDLAVMLAEHGISSLRYDKRTYVCPDTVGSMDRETILDALSAVSLARVYSNNVVLMGHSLGAMLAPLIARRTPLLGGLVMMAAPARNLDEVVAGQLAHLAEPGTTAEAQAAALEQLRRQTPHYFEPQGQVEAARRLSIPMLLVQGGRDYQVTMSDFRLWQQALQGHPGATLKDYPRLNHLFMEGEGPSTPQEYMRPGTVDRQVADDIARFVLGLFP